MKEELYQLVREDPAIFEFLQNGSLDGIWYWDLENPETKWMSPRFWNVFGYDPAEKPHLADAGQDMIHADDLKLAIDHFQKHCDDPNHSSNIPLQRADPPSPRTCRTPVAPASRHNVLKQNRSKGG